MCPYSPHTPTETFQESLRAAITLLIICSPRSRIRDILILITGTSDELKSMEVVASRNFQIN